jgi:general secretion pathway protein B
MSLILDALRKMDLERKAKRLSSHEIRTDVLHYRGTGPASEKSRLVPITAAVVIVSAAGAFFYSMSRTDAPGKGTEVASLQQQRPVTLPQSTPQPQPGQQPMQQLPAAPVMQKSIRSEAKRKPETSNPPERAEKPLQNLEVEGLTVAGIAWQEERSLRRAVVNGALVGEGEEIQGAKIIEIRENRVRFSRGGTVFEIQHSAGTGR